MKKKSILYCLLSLILCLPVAAQTLSEAKAMYSKGDYAKAKTTFEHYAKRYPNNANYNLWYGVCCLKTNEAEKAIKPLETAVKRRATGGQFYLGQAYNDTYRFQDAVDTYQEYISELIKLKRPADEAEKLLSQCRNDLLMIKGVEKVCVIDSFVVDKANFLKAYKISKESGQLYNYNDYFKTIEKNAATVYESQLKDRIYYSERDKNNNFRIYSKQKLSDRWMNPVLLPDNINAAGNTAYPFVMTDGQTIYYATDGNGLGGYDIYATRYNTDSDSFLNPVNIGMPYNSPANDYMYVIDEFNQLGWFASDRYQPEGKVCIYVFVPNETKKVYDYDNTDQKKLISLAQLRSIKDTWEDKNIVAEAKQRMKEADTPAPIAVKERDFEFIINDEKTYHELSDFTSQKAADLFQQYKTMKKDYQKKETTLEQQRLDYAQATKDKKTEMAAGIIDLEQRVQQIYQTLHTLEKEVRNTEIIKLK